MPSPAQTPIAAVDVYAEATPALSTDSALVSLRERLSDMTNALGQRDTAALEQRSRALRPALIRLRLALDQSPTTAASAEMRLQLNLMRAEVSAQRETLARASAAVARHLAAVFPAQQSPLYSQRGNTALAGYAASEKA